MEDRLVKGELLYNVVSAIYGGGRAIKHRCRKLIETQMLRENLLEEKTFELNWKRSMNGIEG